MNHYKKRIACWQDDDELLQNKDRKDGKVWLNQMIMNNRVGEWTNRGAMERYSSYQDVCCILNLRIVLLIKPQSVIRLFCANKHSFNLTQQSIPYIKKIVLGVNVTYLGCCQTMSKLNPNRSLDYYAQTNFLFVICLSVFQLQWNPIAPSKRRDIWSKTRVVIIITLMTDLG